MIFKISFIDLIRRFMENPTTKMLLVAFVIDAYLYRTKDPNSIFHIHNMGVQVFILIKGYNLSRILMEFIIISKNPWSLFSIQVLAGKFENLIGGFRPINTAFIDWVHFS
jgi:hypothetical protein